MDSLVGEYEYTVSAVLSGSVPAGEERCGMPYPPRAQDGALQLRKDSSGYYIATQDGCLLRVERQGELVVAVHEACELDPNGANAVWGIEKLPYFDFELDIRRGIRRSSAKPYLYTGREYCTTIGGMLRGKTSSMRFRYEGTFAWSNQVPVEEGCAWYQDDWTTSGYVTLEWLGEREVRIEEEGTGCGVTGRSEDGVHFTADACEFPEDERFGLPFFGVLEKRFRSYTFDAEANTIDYEAEVIRETLGSEWITCHRVSVQLEQPDGG